MTGGKQTIYLASQSPRRREMLQRGGFKVQCIAARADETLLPQERPAHAVQRIARAKFSGIPQLPKDGFVLTADTVVALAGRILGKPGNAVEAQLMLEQLSGKTHRVYTGYFVYSAATKRHLVGWECTKVRFRKLSANFISNYVATGSPLDKAGAYGIQDPEGPLLVESITGCYYNVVGLPLAAVYKALLLLGYREP